MFNKTYTRIKGGLRLISRHPILNELVDCLYKTIDERVLNKDCNIIIFCGAHKRYYFDWFRQGFKIVIQTEQFYDENRKKLWGITHIKKHLLRSNIKKSDLVIDLNPDNKFFYENDLIISDKELAKIVFGPYIFPSSAAVFSFKSGGDYILFYGGVNRRRQEIIDGLDLNCKIVTGVFGSELEKQASQSLSVLNIHFQDGIYTEWPRLFSALISGKVVVSERLAKPLEPNTHYIPIEKYMDFNTQDNELIYNKLAALVTERFSLVKLIKEKFEGSKSIMNN
jgi:hypothetical protein